MTTPAATSYVVTVPNANLSVTSGGYVTTNGTLSLGTYQVAGTDSDLTSDTGGWTFSLSVTAVTIAQSAPTSASVTTTQSSASHTQLVTTPAATSYVVTVPNTNLSVTSGGYVTTNGTLPVGTYQVGGTDSDLSGDTGGWTFALTVTAVTITQSAPMTDTVATAASRAYTNQLVTVGNGAVNYAETSSTYSGTVLVSSSGAVTTINTLSCRHVHRHRYRCRPELRQRHVDLLADGDWPWRNSCANSSCCSYGLHQFTKWDVLQFDRDGYRDQ